jgi:plasmid stability protein
MEQILIRHLPPGTKAALRAHAKRHDQSVEAAARDLPTQALHRDPATIVDLLTTDEGAEIDFDPQRLALTQSPVDV